MSDRQTDICSVCSKNAKNGIQNLTQITQLGQEDKNYSQTELSVLC